MVVKAKNDPVSFVLPSLVLHEMPAQSQGFPMSRGQRRRVAFSASNPVFEKKQNQTRITEYGKFQLTAVWSNDTIVMWKTHLGEAGVALAPVRGARPGRFLER